MMTGTTWGSRKTALSACATAARLRAMAAAAATPTGVATSVVEQAAISDARVARNHSIEPKKARYQRSDHSCGGNCR